MKKFLYCSVILLTVLLTTVSGISATYTGVVVPTATSTCAFLTFTDIYGNYAYIARPGEIITPSVCNTKGEFIKPGNVLLQMDMRYWDAVLAGYKAAYDASVRNLKLAHIQRLRYEKLYSTKATSQDLYDQAQTDYYNKLISWANARAQYQQYKVQVERYTDVAPFEGIVTADLTTIGFIIGGAPAISVDQLNPIGIKVKMDRETAKEIKNNTPVKIYPLNSDKPQGIIYGSTVLTDDGIEFVTENYPVVAGTKVIPDTTHRIIRSWFPVTKFYVDKKHSVLAVSSGSLVSEGDKFFVWKAKGQKTMQPDKAIENYFKIEKVYVKPHDLLRNVDNYEKKIALDDKGSLELFDIVMGDPPDGLAEGETVLYPEGSYLLMPGDPVKVVVGGK
jgi:hypothetical protein